MTSEGRTIALGLVAAGAAFLATLAVTPLLREVSLLRGLLYLYAILLPTGVSFAAVFAALRVVGRMSSLSTHPGTTAAGAVLGTLVGLWGLGYQGFGLSGLWVFSALFAYASFVLSAFVRDQVPAAVTDLTRHVVVASALYLPLAALRVSFYWAPLLLVPYALVVSASFIGFLSLRPRRFSGELP
jgi:hypothetical protein